MSISGIKRDSAIGKAISNKVLVPCK